ncbi:MAG: hypothetical protein E7458_00925 [Ruminococcaceae bacterium]|nr:hypothetical protein [Oscillospiraceae bacterium]
MKRIFSLIMAFLLLFLTACAADPAPEQEDAQTAETSDVPLMAEKDTLYVYDLYRYFNEVIAFNPIFTAYAEIQSRMIHVGGDLYLCTGLKGDQTVDEPEEVQTIKTSVAAGREPQKNRQSNFGTGHTFYEVEYGIDLLCETDEDAQMMRYVRLDEKDDWGLTLTPYAVRPDGMILLMTQYGGELGKALRTGSYFHIERKENGIWKQLYTPRDWTMEGYGVPRGFTTIHEVDWSWLHGDLEPGEYRITKHFYPPQGGHEDRREYSVEFTIE